MKEQETTRLAYMESLLGVLAENNYARGKKWSMALLVFSVSTLLVATYYNFGYSIGWDKGFVVPRIPQFLIILLIIGVLFALVKVNLESRRSKLKFWGLSLPIGLLCILHAIQPTLSLISPLVLLMLYTRTGYFGKISACFCLVIFASGWLLYPYLYLYAGSDHSALRLIALAFVSSINLLPLSWLTILSILEIKRFSLLMDHKTQA